MKVDKSLQEVWDWKNNVYRQIKHLSVRDAAKKIHEDVQQIKKATGLKLKPFRLLASKR
jgi:shikimate kinase